MAARYARPSEKGQPRRRYVDNRQRPAFHGRKTGRREFRRGGDGRGAGEGINRSLPASGVFADAVSARCAASATPAMMPAIDVASQSRSFFAPLRRNNCKLANSLRRETNWNLLRLCPDAKRAAGRIVEKLDFSLAVDSLIFTNGHLTRRTFIIRREAARAALRDARRRSDIVFRREKKINGLLRYHDLTRARNDADRQLVKSNRNIPETSASEIDTSSLGY